MPLHSGTGTLTMVYRWFSDISIVFMGLYPPVNVYKKTMNRSTMLWMGKSTTSMAMLNSYVSLPESKYSDHRAIYFILEPCHCSTVVIEGYGPL